MSAHVQIRTGNGAGSVRPDDLTPLTAVEQTPLDSIAGIVESARRSQSAWAALSLPHRSARLRRLAHTILERRNEIIRLLGDEMGRGWIDNLTSEVAGVGEVVEEAIRVAERALAPEPVPISKLTYPGKSATIEAVARGVVCIIAPWNYALGNFFKHLFPALLAGNGVVLKPSEHTPRCGAWLHARCGEVFPAGLVGLVQGGGAAGAALLEAGVDSVCFTGSVRTGKRIAAACGERLIPCTVELGGVDAAIVLDDCDLDRTVAGVAQWSMFNAGQDCSSIERVFVQDDIHAEFVSRLARYVASFRVGGERESDVGPLQNALQLRIVEEHVEDARAKGARVLCGGRREGAGFGYAPTVLDGCTPEMRVMNEETFGPVVAVARVSTVAEAVRRANDSSMGLNGSVWTKDIEKGIDVARSLECGVAFVNNHSIAGAMPAIPWTGVKDTGYGVANSVHAYPAYVRRRTLFVDRGKSPDPWWKPIDRNAFVFGEALAEKGLGGGVRSLLKLATVVGKRVRAIRERAAKSASRT